MLAVALLSCFAPLPSPASADEYLNENPMVELHQMQRNARRAALRTNADPADGDTVWVGHVVGTHSVPWSSNPNWSGYGPFHVGRGGYRVTTSPSSPVTLSNNGYWDFDRLNPGEADTLQGWTPVRHPQSSISGFTGSDRMILYTFCQDYGNSGNHRPNSLGKRGYGVLGYWHVDGGSTQPAVAIPNTTPVAPTWTPITGAGSAWCGLRAHGDISAGPGDAPGTPTDHVTGNYHVSTIVQNYGDNHFRQTDQQNPTGFSDANYPGYGSQWDQILYRDFTADGAGNVNVSFDYRTALSSSKANDQNGNAYGYYLNDPLKIPSLNDGNFISGSDAGPANAPRDSFMVYVGTPVNDAAWVGANGGAPKPVFDPQRRWFSEVINIYSPYRRIFSKTGVMPAALSSGPLVAGGFSPGATVRVVFRVKTDRAFDDEDTYQRGFGSGTVGAVLLDNVVVNGGPSHGFDNVSDIDNDTATPPSAAWKATGKPISANWHWHNLENNTPYTNLIYADPCGPIGGAFRTCNMRGNVLSIGNHDLNELTSGNFGGWDRDHQDYIVSPTICLKASGNGPGFYNELGIDEEIARATDIRVRFDIFTHGFDLVNSGGGIRIGWNFYPAQQGAVTGPNPAAVTNAGVKVWSQRKRAQFTSYTFTFGCFSFANPSGSNGILDNLIKTSNVSGVPDSIQIVIERLTRCFSSLEVNLCAIDQSDPAGGGYIDNIAVGFIDAPPPAAPAVLSMVPWNIFQDAFPYDGTTADATIGTPAFDRLTCLTRSGFNVSALTGNQTRPVIAGDSIAVVAPGANVRVDLVFRVYPGPGNYVTIGDRTSGLCQSVPANGCTPAIEGDGSWWGTLMNDVGLFGTYKNPGISNSAGGAPYRMRDVNGGATAANEWDPNAWISVRMDTLERVTNDASRILESYMSTIHERDYSPDPTDADPDHSRRAALALDEGAKILPNTLFTPGTHIEYFFRRSLIGNTVDSAMMPDTTRIQPQPQLAGGSWDGVRFATWDALPDRWKDPAYGGAGAACMLVANYGSRRGDLVLWDNMSRAIGLTRPEKWGAGHGFWSSPTGDLPASISDLAGNGGFAVSANLGHEGSLYDVYDVVGGDSNVPAGRLGNRTALGGSPTPTGPSRKMLRSYYRNLLVLSADINGSLFGPFTDQSDDDAGLFTDYVTNGSPAGVRSMTLIGGGIGTSLGDWSSTNGFLRFQLGARFFNKYPYTAPGVLPFSDGVADLLIPGSSPFAPGFTSGVWANCAYLSDAFELEPGYPSVAAMNYENIGDPYDPWAAAVYYAENPGAGRHARSLIMGWTFGVFGSRGMQGGQQGTRHTVTRDGMYALWLEVLADMVQSCAPFGSPIGVGDLPWQDGTSFVSFLGLRSENPARHGMARLAFGVERTERVEISIYDIGGRRVRKLADRVFEGGKSHELIWDGTDDSGRRQGAGVYFYRVKSATFSGQKKLTVLRD